MNRKQKRKFMKIASNRGADKTVVDVYLRLKENGVEDLNIKDGDKVRLNLRAIQSHPDYPKLSLSYRQFVEDNAETVFTAEYESEKNIGKLVCLHEDSARWHFWPGDLIKVSE